MPFDLDTLLGSDPSGLLTPQERGGVTGQGLMGMGAALLKAAAPSPYKHTTLSGLGEGVSGLLSGKQAATDELLKQHLVRAKTLEGALPFYKLLQDQATTGMPMEPWQRQFMQTIGPALGMPGGFGAGVPGAPGAAPGLGRGAPGGVSPQPGAPAAIGAAAQEGGFKIPSDWRPPPQSPGALPPTDIRQYHADMNGFNRRATLPGAPGNAAFEDSFKESHAGFPGGAKGYELQKGLEETGKKQSESYNKQYIALQALGRTSHGVAELMDQAKAIMDRPDFRSSTGVGAEMKLLFRQLQATFGGDPNAAFSVEAFKKIFSEALQARIEEAKDIAQELGPAGRQYVTQLNIMANASPKTDITLPTNRYLVDQTHREALRNVGVADKATEYAQNSPLKRLDLGWDTALRRHLAENPIYSKKTLEDIPKDILPGSPAPAAPPVTSGPAPMPGAIGPLGQGGPAATAPAPTKTATGPKGARLGLINGQWVPLGQ